MNFEKNKKMTEYDKNKIKEGFELNPDFWETPFKTEKEEKQKTEEKKNINKKIIIGVGVFMATYFLNKK